MESQWVFKFLSKSWRKSIHKYGSWQSQNQNTDLRWKFAVREQRRKTQSNTNQSKSIQEYTEK